jgi:excisionase family DNA binding protein
MATDTPQRPLMTPSEVGALFRVDPKTVTRWAVAGRIRSIRTPGGRRRFLRSEVQALLTAHDSDRLPAQDSDSDLTQDAGVLTDA